MTAAPTPSPAPYRPSPADRRRAWRTLARMAGVLAVIAVVVALAWNPVANYFQPPDTPLQAAVTAGDVDAVRTNLGPQDSPEASAIAYTAYERALRHLSPSNPATTEILRLILARDPQPGRGGAGAPPRRRAANAEFTVIRRTQSSVSVSAVELAARQWSPDGVRALLDAGLDVKSVGVSGALTAAGANGSEPIVRILLDAGADVNGRDRNRDTALAMARRMNHAELVTLLLSRGARD